MKKLLIVLSILFVMSGCSKSTEKYSCSSTTTANGITTKTTYDIEHIDDDIKYITITYDYNQDNTNNDIDGLNADTDGLDKDNNKDTNNDNIKSDDIVDGVVGDVIDGAVDGVKDTILDLTGIKDRYTNQLNTYKNVEGFSYDVDVDSNTEYKVIYKIDMSKLKDDDLSRFNVTRDFSEMKTNYMDSGYTCDKK